MTDLLKGLKDLDKNIRIGISGIGSIGKGMVLQAKITPGIECVVIADIIIERAIACAIQFKMDYKVVGTAGEMHDAIRLGKLAICEDGNLAASCEDVDIFIEATNSTPAGGKFALTAIENNKHLIMMNYEADLMFGPYLMHLAEKSGLIYTVSDGNQPAVIKHLVDELEFMGFQLVMAGNIKGYLDRYINPTSIIPKADKHNLDHKMCSSYTDGTKLCVKMAVLANGLGLSTAVPGMHGPRVKDINEIFEHFDFETLWKNRQPLVDYIVGAKPKGGIFAIGYTDNKYQQDTLSWLPPEMGAGPFYLFYRPYHLCHFETMVSVAEIALNKRPALKPDFGFRTNVYSYAKRNIRKGEKLDGMGGYTCYGLIENCIDNEKAPGIPVCLSDNVTLKHDTPKDEKILLKNVTYDPNDYAFKLYLKAQEQSNKIISKS